MRLQLSSITKKLGLLTVSLWFTFSGSVLALTPEQQKVIDSNIGYFNVELSSSGACGGGGLSGNNDVEKVYNFFVGKGLAPHQAAGIIGNMAVESGVQPQRLQGTGSGVITPAESFSGGSGWGIVQWTPGSKFIDKIKPASDANKLEVQLEFLWEQLEGKGPLPEKTAGDDLKSAPTVEEAVLAFQGNLKVGGKYMGFERPADQAGSVAERTAAAKDALLKFGSGSPTVGGVCGGGVTAEGCPKSPVPESETVVVEGIRVHPCIAPEVEKIIKQANSQGLNMSGGGWVTKEVQENKRRNNGCAGREYDESCIGNPQTAIPGTSRHERGTAIDFTCNGTTIPTRSHACFVFMSENSSLKNLPKETWHWSVDGG